MTYIVRRVRGRGSPDPAKGEAAVLSHWRPEGSDHRPPVTARLIHDGARLLGRFEVADRYVRAVATEYGGRVWEDSCVEFFFQPVPGKGHFAFEFSCGGVFLANYVTDPARVPGGFKAWRPLSLKEVSAVRVRSLYKAPIAREIALPTAWWLEYEIPVSALEPFVGKLGPLKGQRWRGNFTKCADACSHPHWGSWAPLSRKEFHAPAEFEELVFE